MLIGIVGKPSAGKSTFLNAACMTNAKVGSYPFTTIEANPGISYVKRKCICQELNVNDEPKNSTCEAGIRFAPVDLLDVAGLVPGAHEGKGMGNKFLNDLSRASILLHIVDFSGSLNEKGEDVKPGTRDPLDDMKFLEDEISQWIKKIITRTDWDRFVRTTHMNKIPIQSAITKRLTGIGVKEFQVSIALKQANLTTKSIRDWNDDELLSFSRSLQHISKPIIIVANKVDKKEAIENYERISKMPEYKGNIFPCSALAEFYLRTFANDGIIDYIPGAPDFKIKDPESISQKKKITLERMREEILSKFGSTGVQDALNKAIFDVLDYIYVYPVNDANKFTDHDGRVLPDVFLVKKGTKLIEFVAEKIHTDLAEHFIFGVNAKNKKRLGEDYELQPDDVIKIQAAK